MICNFLNLEKHTALLQIGKYEEQQHISIYITGKKNADGWKVKGEKADFYFAKAYL